MLILKTCNIKDTETPIWYFEYQPEQGGKDGNSPEASKPAKEIFQANQLFEIEADLQGAGTWKKKRLIREKPLLEAFWSWAEKNIAKKIPKSKLSKAFHYALNHWQEFHNYLKFVGTVPWKNCYWLKSPEKT